MHLFLAVLGLHGCVGSSPVAARGPLTVVACCGTRAPAAAAPGLRAQSQKLCCTGVAALACGIFPDQGSNPCLLHWQADSYPPSNQRSSLMAFYPFTRVKTVTNDCH